VSSRIDPAGEGPRLFFQRVPEGKTAKNRVHLDIRVAGRGVTGEERKRLVSEGRGRDWERGNCVVDLYGERRYVRITPGAPLTGQSQVHNEGARRWTVRLGHHGALTSHDAIA